MIHDIRKRCYNEKYTYGFEMYYKASHSIQTCAKRQEAEKRLKENMKPQRPRSTPARAAAPWCKWLILHEKL